MSTKRDIFLVAANNSSCIDTNMLVAFREKGNIIQAIMLGSNLEYLFLQLEELYPQYKFTKNFDSKQSKDLVIKLERYMVNPKQSYLDFSLNVKGTEFQKLVWSELCKIPFGVQKSYADIAKSIGRPYPVRAVANACGKNNIPIIIPCHRVIRSNGTLGGYSSGTGIKMKLIEIEQNIILSQKQNREKL